MILNRLLIFLLLFVLFFGFAAIVVGIGCFVAFIFLRINAILFVMGFAASILIWMLSGKVCEYLKRENGNKP